MAINNRQGGKVIKNVRKEDTPGTRVEPYPYLGIIKNNIDPIRAGRIQVWIPEFGGDSEEPKNWRTVSYASPYMGSTYIAPDGSKTNSWNESPHTYGMWMTPPDIGVEVLVIFLGGDPLKGYWLSCVNSQISRYMFPGNASTQYPSTAQSSDEVKKLYEEAKSDWGDIVSAPVTEFNSNKQDFAQDPAFVNIARPIHEPQYKILIEQGLDRDYVRGTLTSSSQRETPSAVFGISTPGRALNDPALDPTYQDKLKAGTLKESDYAVKTRLGGHTLIMDDGDINGKNNVVRLRSAGGHQIVFNDSGNSLYISNKTGSVWLEFNDENKISMFSDSDIDVRTNGSFNFHAAKDFNLDVGGNFNARIGKNVQIDSLQFTAKASTLFTVSADISAQIRGGTSINLDAGSLLSLKSGGQIIGQAPSIIWGGSATAVIPPKPIPVNQVTDTVKENGIWKQKPSVLTTILPVAPSHEPSHRNSMQKVPVPPAPPDPSEGVPTKPSSPAPVPYKKSEGLPVDHAVTESDIRNQPLASSGIGSLGKEHMTAFLAQVSKPLPSMPIIPNPIPLPIPNPITLVNGAADGFGKYNFGIDALKSNGLIKDSVTSMSQLSLNSNWIRDKCGGITEFAQNSTLQNQMAVDLAKQTYNKLCTNGVINDLNKNDPAEVMGWMSVAHRLGPDACYAHAKTGVFGAFADKIFQQGKYAATNMASQVYTILNG